MSKDTAQLYISGSIPCVICGKAVTQENVSRGDVILSMQTYAYPAHTIHFFKDSTGAVRQPDYEDQMTRFALAVGIGEHMPMPGLESDLRPLYEQVAKQMRDWNHPAFVVRPEQRN